MALYGYQQFLTLIAHESFNVTFAPGTATPYSGIYRCEGCGKEIAANQGNPLPPQNHHQHSAQQGAIRWRMIVFAQTDK